MKDINYRIASDAVRKKYNFQIETVSPERANITCRICEIIVEPDYLISRFNSVISVAEQEHVHSDEHQQLALMQKLAS